MYLESKAEKAALRGSAARFARLVGRDHKRPVRRGMVRVAPAKAPPLAAGLRHVFIATQAQLNRRICRFPRSKGFESARGRAIGA